MPVPGKKNHQDTKGAKKIHQEFPFVYWRFMGIDRGQKSPTTDPLGRDPTIIKGSLGDLGALVVNRMGGWSSRAPNDSRHMPCEFAIVCLSRAHRRGEWDEPQ